MRTGLLVPAALLLELTTALHLLEPRTVSPLRHAELRSLDTDILRAQEPSVLHMDTYRKQISNPVQRDIRRRASTLQASLDNEETLYFVNVSLGTPAQSLRLDIDTGSSDLWANSPDSEICQSRGDICGESGTFDANSSSTYSYVNSAFFIKYADGTFASGDYGKDKLSIGGQTITNMQFGIGINSTSQNGILGIGYEALEVQVSMTGKSYSNLPARLVDDGVIQSNAYSLWLNDLDANTGSILFGGVDSDKYHGSLATLPIVQEQGQYVEFLIALTGLSAGSNTIFNDTSNAVAVLLDSGSSLSYLPDDYVNSLFSTFNADYRSSEGVAIVDCSLADDSRTVDFTFSGPTISVSLSELVIVAAVDRGNPVCILGISRAGQSTSVLGDTFLRSAYVVYDLDNNEISLASTNFNATSSNVQEIGSGSSAVPDATAVANAVSMAGSVETGGARNGGLPSGVSAADMSMSRQSMTSVIACATAVAVAVTFGVSLAL